MAQIINLRAARKARLRQSDGAKADENAAKFGRTKPQKAREAAEADKARAALDGAKRESSAALDGAKRENPAALDGVKREAPPE